MRYQFAIVLSGVVGLSRSTLFRRLEKHDRLSTAEELRLSQNGSLSLVLGYRDLRQREARVRSAGAPIRVHGYHDSWSVLIPPTTLVSIRVSPCGMGTFATLRGNKYPRNSYDALRRQVAALGCASFEISHLAQGRAPPTVSRKDI
jgi:hypothetical protein